MSLFLAILGWTLFGFCILGGLILDVVGLFGNWVILATVTVAWVVTGFDHFSFAGLGVMVVLAVVGELLEALAASYGASKFGGGRGASVAALVGCFLGVIVGTPLIPVPVVGSLIGACGGAFLAAGLYEYIQMEKKAHEALWTGLGAALGRMAGLFAKLFCGLVMLAVAAWTF